MSCMNSEPGTRVNLAPYKTLAASTIPIPSGSNRSASLKISYNNGSLGTEKFFSGLAANIEWGLLPDSRYALTLLTNSCLLRGSTQILRIFNLLFKLHKPFVQGFHLQGRFCADRRDKGDLSWHPSLCTIQDPAFSLNTVRG